MILSAYVGIKPNGSLQDVAAKLSKALSVAFSAETTGRYEEYPAYCAETVGLDLALLGVPEPQDDIRDEPTQDFELQALSRTSGDPVVDLSAYFVEIIKLHTDLDCWVLK